MSKSVRKFKAKRSYNWPQNFRFYHRAMNCKRSNAAKERREKAAATASATNGVYRYHGKSLRLHQNRLKTSCPILAHWQLQELRTFYTLYFWAPPSTCFQWLHHPHYFFTIEWILCVVCFEPSSQQHPDLSFFTKLKLWFQ